MGAINHSVATLRLFGDDLAPDEISALLGAGPTVSYRKGQELVGSKTGVVRIAKTGSWRLSATRREPEDLEAQIFEILEQLTQDLNVWESLARFQPDLFCGLFMGSSNDGLPLSAKALLFLGQRGVALELDIYDVG
ncbi:DUF4279 domain-containing protein [Stenotrophomonas sp.]|uniref:DUF4279 domain-containing protein n=1 Tax=Stenotrophomonas sp. TaxID=69392 RepID=UPI0028AFBF6F|nr:DUF4279 domain-containing protein [Stenotrophomonas sp.]